MLVGYGQVNQHDDHPGVEPVDLMVAAARAAADPRVLEAVDSVRVVNVLSWRYRDPGLLLGPADPRRRRRHPLHRRRRQRAADAGQPGVPGHPGRPRGRGADRGRRNLAHPNATACQRRQAGLDEPGRVGSDGRRRRRGRADGRPRGDPDQPGPARPTSTRCSSRRCGSRRASPSTTTAAASASCGRSSARSRRTTRTPGAAEPLSPRRSGSPDRDNRMISWPYTKLMNSNNMVDQGAALDPDLGREGDLPADSHRALGFPVRGHRRARHLRDRRARGVPPVAGDPDRRAAGAANWPASASTTSTWSTSTRASRRRCRWPPPNSGCRSAIPAGR